MRLFIAVEIGPEIAPAAAALVDDLRRRAAKLAPHAKITWIPPERLHLTVRFIGHAGDENYHVITSALEPRLDTGSFDLSLTGAATFPRTGPPQVIWAGIASGLHALRQLEQEVTARLERAGVPPDNRPYSPHLTLARIREAAGLRSGALLEGYRDTPLGATHVGAITLFESRPSPKGPTYVRVQRTPLTR